MELGEPPVQSSEARPVNAQQLDRVVPFPVDRVFGAFTDLASYPRVLRLVRSAEILDRTQSTLPETIIVRFALKVGYGVISTRFLGRALVNQSEHLAIIAQESGPFETFKSRIKLSAADEDRTRIHVVAEWAFAPSGVGALIAGLLEDQTQQALRRLVGAFIRHLGRDEPAAPAAQAGARTLTTAGTPGAA
jgi:ribosome-associated toxin RatA of RatAB toxin-antitoxin module